MRAGRSVLARSSEGWCPRGWTARARSNANGAMCERREAGGEGEDDARVEKGQSSVYIFKAKQLTGHLGRTLLTRSVYSRSQSAAPCTAYRLIYPSIVIAPVRPRRKKKKKEKEREGEPPHLAGPRQMCRHVAS